MSLRSAAHRRVAGVASAALVAAVALSAQAPLGRLGSDLAGRAAAGLERRFPPKPLSQESRVDGVVVLGGGLQRAQHAAALALRYPQARVILSGPSRREEALLQRVPDLAGRLVVDRHARTTHENAVFSRNIAAPRPGERWLLVTSAVHMPRAIGAFRGAGFDVEPQPVRSANGARSAASLAHELLGLVYYRVLGRIPAFLPAAST